METADHKPRAKGIPYESDYWLGGMILWGGIF
jgi:hypothetical protein